MPIGLHALQMAPLIPAVFFMTREKGFVSQSKTFFNWDNSFHPPLCLRLMEPHCKAKVIIDWLVP